MFISREEELTRLKQLKQKKTASLIVVKGRRRIGKSRLIKEFSKSYNKVVTFEGLAPFKGITNKDQLNNFSLQLASNFKTKKKPLTNWLEAFQELSQYTQTGEVLVVIDEISWLGHKDKNFSGYLKIAWDTLFSQNKRLILIICGSISSWIEENILKNTGFVGRISLTLRLNELPIAALGKFWGEKRFYLDSKEILTILSVTGGVPRYLEEINPKETASENIKKICFTKGGYLFEDFSRIFTDIFEKRSAKYLKIIKSLILNQLTLKEISKITNISLNGKLSADLNDLIESGFISEASIYNPRTNKFGNTRYRISDNYIRFYLKYIEPNQEKIGKGLFKFSALNQLINWNVILGLQFENLIINNIPEIIQLLNLQNEIIISASPFIQRKTKTQEGCQIDLLILTKSRNIYVCEIKFQEFISSSIIDEMKKKIKKVKFKKNYSIRPVIIYAGTLESDVIELEFFDKILDVGELVKRK